jgi:hypothetical protein
VKATTAPAVVPAVETTTAPAAPAEAPVVKTTTAPADVAPVVKAAAVTDPPAVVPAQTALEATGDENAQPNNSYQPAGTQYNSPEKTDSAISQLSLLFVPLQAVSVNRTVKGNGLPDGAIVVDLTAEEPDTPAVARRTRSHTRPSVSTAAPVPIRAIKSRTAKPITKRAVAVPFQADLSLLQAVGPIALPAECLVQPPTAHADLDTLTKLFATANMDGPPPSRSQRVAPLPFSALAAAVNSAAHGNRG